MRIRGGVVARGLTIDGRGTPQTKQLEHLTWFLSSGCLWAATLKRPPSVGSTGKDRFGTPAGDQPANTSGAIRTPASQVVSGYTICQRTLRKLPLSWLRFCYILELGTTVTHGNGVRADFMPILAKEDDLFPEQLLDEPG